LDSQFKANKFYTSRRNEPQDKTLEHGHQFRIRHYAGDVTYSINGFIDKSKDLVFQDFKRLLFGSKQPAISSMWKDGAQAKSIVTKRPPAAGTLFKQSMQELIKNLSSKEVSFLIKFRPPNNVLSHFTSDALNQTRSNHLNVSTPTELLIKSPILVLWKTFALEKLDLLFASHMIDSCRYKKTAR